MFPCFSLLKTKLIVMKKQTHMSNSAIHLNLNYDTSQNSYFNVKLKRILSNMLKIILSKTLPKLFAYSCQYG